jgi:hypothetical protein
MKAAASAAPANARAAAVRLPASNVLFIDLLL